MTGAGNLVGGAGTRPGRRQGQRAGRRPQPRHLRPRRPDRHRGLPRRVGPASSTRATGTATAPATCSPAAPDGSLSLYAGNGAGQLPRPAALGSGFAGVGLVPAGDVTGDGYPDLLGTPANGELMVYGRHRQRDPGAVRAGRRVADQPRRACRRTSPASTGCVGVSDITREGVAATTSCASAARATSTSTGHERQGRRAALPRRAGRRPSTWPADRPPGGHGPVRWPVPRRTSRRDDPGQGVGRGPASRRVRAAR